MKKIVRNSKGFSLPELLVIMFVISALAAGTYTLMQIIRMKGQVTKCLKDTREIAAAMSTFYDDTGAWPCTKGGIGDLSGVTFKGFKSGTLPTDQSFYPKGTDRSPAATLKCVTGAGGVSVEGKHYNNVPAGSWGGPYLQLETDTDGIPNSPWKGRMWTVFRCPGKGLDGGGKGVTGIGVSSCEYGIVITNLPKKAMQELAKKLNGNKQYTAGSKPGQIFAADLCGTSIGGVTDLGLVDGVCAPQNYNGYMFVGEE